MDEINFSMDELNELLGEFDAKSDESTSFDDIELKDIDWSDTELDKKKEFDGKFYVSYLGINPNTIVKEDLDLLSSIVAKNLDGSRLSFLISNLDSFYYYAKDNMDKLSLEDVEVANNMLFKLASGIREFKNLLGLNTFDLTPLKLNSDYEKNTEKILSNATECRVILEEIVNNNVNMKDDSIKYDVYLNLLNTMYLLYSQYGGKLLAYEDETSKYKQTSYEYTDQESRIMHTLGFPTAIMGSEAIFKDNINTHFVKENNRINNYHAKELYNLFTDIRIVGNSRSKLVEYYK